MWLLKTGNPLKEVTISAGLTVLENPCLWACVNCACPVHKTDIKVQFLRAPP